MSDEAVKAVKGQKYLERPPRRQKRARVRFHAISVLIDLLVVTEGGFSAPKHNLKIYKSSHLWELKMPVATADIAQFVPLRRRLGMALTERISRGELKPGDVLPTERELAREFGLSPGTVRLAILDLVGLGLVYRKQGKGTFVNRPMFDGSLTNFFRAPDTGDRILNPPARVLKIDTIRPPGAVRERLRLGDEKVHRVKRVRVHHDLPLMLQTLYFPVRLVPETDRVDFAVFQYSMFEKAYGIYVLRAEEYLKAGVAGDDEAGALGIPKNAPVVLIDRIAYSREDVPIEFRQTVGRGDWYSYVFQLR